MLVKRKICEENLKLEPYRGKAGSGGLLGNWRISWTIALQKNSRRNGENLEKWGREFKRHFPGMPGKGNLCGTFYTPLTYLSYEGIPWNRQPRGIFYQDTVQRNKALDPWLFISDLILLWLFFSLGFAFSVMNDEWLLASWSMLLLYSHGESLILCKILPYRPCWHLSWIYNLIFWYFSRRKSQRLNKLLRACPWAYKFMMYGRRQPCYLLLQCLFFILSLCPVNVLSLLTKSK